MALSNSAHDNHVDPQADDQSTPIPNHDPLKPGSSHPISTCSKSRIHKRRHFPDFMALSTNALHAALLSSFPPKGFKYAAKIIR